MQTDVLIIGNGPAGTNAAITLRNLDPEVKITLISDESPYFYSRPALMYLYLGSLRFSDVQPYEKNFWKKQKIEIIFAKVTDIFPREKFVQTENKDQISFKACLLALGAEPKKLNIPNEHYHGVVNFTNLFELKKLQELTHSPKKISRAFVIGGGLVGVEVAEILRVQKIPVTFVVKESYFYPKALSEKEGRLVEKEIKSHGVELLLNTEVSEFLTENEKLSGVKLKDGQIRKGNLAVVTIGVTPRKALAEKSGISCHEGICVSQELVTNYPGIFAAGDVAEIFFENGQSQNYLLWYTAEKMGKLAGENLYRYLNGKPLIKWEKGLWYNSAKFFSLDWQYFGLEPNLREGEKELFFEFCHGEKILRIVTHNETITALSSLGLRLRESFCKKILLEKQKLSHLKEEIQNLFFDPEFYPEYFREVNFHALSQNS